MAEWNRSELVLAAKRRANLRGERLGQAIYNEAYSRNPAVAKLAGTVADPFYIDGRIAAFLDALSTPIPLDPPKEEV